MKVSLITVTYNSAKYLQDCIRSVINQDYPDIEYIVVDGFSTDNTVDIIKQNEKYIDKWVSEKDNGMYYAINKGMEMATGDIIGTLNSDDILASKDVISSIVAIFNKQQVDSVFGDLTYVDPDNTDKIRRYWKGMHYKRQNFHFGWMPAHPTFYIRKEIVDQLSGYRTDYFSAADFEFMVRYLYRHRISSYYIDKLIVKMRQGGMSNGSLKRRLRANRRDYLALKRNGVPFPFIVSLLKPLRKLPQYYSGYLSNKTQEPDSELAPA